MESEDSNISDSEVESFEIEESGSDSSCSEGEDSSDSDSSVDWSALRQWCEIDNAQQPRPPAHLRYPFQGVPSSNFELPADEGGDLLQYFKLFFDDNLLEIIVAETNRFAEQTKNKQPGTSTKFRPTTKEEIIVFFCHSNFAEHCEIA